LGAWCYSCALGLAQGTCRSYEPDPESRGYGRWSGCPSCRHRVPANRETRLADLKWEEARRR